MKQIRKKIKLIMHYIPSGYYDEKDKAHFFIKCNESKKDVYLDRVGAKDRSDFTMNELLTEIRKYIEGELEDEND